MIKINTLLKKLKDYKDKDIIKIHSLVNKTIL